MWEEPSRQTSSLGRDADDADTIWALQNGSLFSSQQIMRFLGGWPGGSELPVAGGMQAEAG